MRISGLNILNIIFKRKIKKFVFNRVQKSKNSHQSLSKPPSFGNLF